MHNDPIAEVSIDLKDLHMTINYLVEDYGDATKREVIEAEREEILASLARLRAVLEPREMWV